jgi:hypothetical protein
MGSWYYVHDNGRVGPIEEEEFSSLVTNGVVDEDSYVWTKGFENWVHFKEVPELQKFLVVPEVNDQVPDFNVGNDVDWNSINRSERLITVKIGIDRGGDETEYGPYSLEELKKLKEEGRINDRTFIFMSGMDNWTFLADIPIYEEVFNNLPPVIDDKERRTGVRKPFVARMLFHNDQTVYEGICRDISVGGMQVLVSNFPALSGDVITMNVHPDNGGLDFTAMGEIVRILPGRQGFSLRFVNLTSEAQDKINEYISTRG